MRFYKDGRGSPSTVNNKKTPAHPHIPHRSNSQTSFLQTRRMRCRHRASLLQMRPRIPKLRDPHTRQIDDEDRTRHSMINVHPGIQRQHELSQMFGGKENTRKTGLFAAGREQVFWAGFSTWNTRIPGRRSGCHDPSIAASAVMWHQWPSLGYQWLGEGDVPFVLSPRTERSLCSSTSHPAQTSSAMRPWHCIA